MTSEGFTIRSFSISLEKVAILKQLEELGHKEGKSQSAMVVLAIEEYVARHSPGNPQLTFNENAQVVLPKSAVEKPKLLKCSRCGQPATRIYFLQQGGHVPTCSNHKIGRQRGVVGFKEIKK